MPSLQIHDAGALSASLGRILLTCAACLGSASLGGSLAGCVTTTTSQPVGLERAILTTMPVSRAWIVEDGGIPAGSVVRYSASPAGEGPDGAFLYVVRNLWDQDLGVVDERGRAWRRMPHRDDQWIGTGTVVQGVRQILSASARPRMVEMPIEDVEPATATARGR